MLSSNTIKSLLEGQKYGELDILLGTHFKGPEKSDLESSRKLINLVAFHLFNTECMEADIAANLVKYFQAALSCVGFQAGKVSALLAGKIFESIYHVITRLAKNGLDVLATHFLPTVQEFCVTFKKHLSTAKLHDFIPLQVLNLAKKSDSFDITLQLITSTLELHTSSQNFENIKGLLKLCSDTVSVLKFAFEKHKIDRQTSVLENLLQSSSGFVPIHIFLIQLSTKNVCEKRQELVAQTLDTFNLLQQLNEPYYEHYSQKFMYASCVAGQTLQKSGFLLESEEILQICCVLAEKSQDQRLLQQHCCVLAEKSGKKSPHSCNLTEKVSKCCNLAEKGENTSSKCCILTEKSAEKSSHCCNLAAEKSESNGGGVNLATLYKIRFEVLLGLKSHYKAMECAAKLFELLTKDSVHLFVKAKRRGLEKITLYEMLKNDLNVAKLEVLAYRQYKECSESRAFLCGQIISESSACSKVDQAMAQVELAWMAYFDPKSQLKSEIDKLKKVQVSGLKKAYIHFWLLLLKWAEVRRCMAKEMEKFQEKENKNDEDNREGILSIGDTYCPYTKALSLEKHKELICHLETSLENIKLPSKEDWIDNTMVFNMLSIMAELSLLFGVSRCHKIALNTAVRLSSPIECAVPLDSTRSCALSGAPMEASVQQKSTWSEMENYKKSALFDLLKFQQSFVGFEEAFRTILRSNEDDLQAALATAYVMYCRGNASKALKICGQLQSNEVFKKATFNVGRRLLVAEIKLLQAKCLCSRGCSEEAEGPIQFGLSACKITASCIHFLIGENSQEDLSCIYFYSRATRLASEARGLMCDIYKWTGLAREMRMMGKVLLDLGQKQVAILPRIAHNLLTLIEVDLVCDDPQQAQVKLTQVENMLNNIVKGKEENRSKRYLQVPQREDMCASPALKRPLYSPPSWIAHDLDMCKCDACNNVLFWICAVKFFTYQGVVYHMFGDLEGQEILFGHAKKVRNVLLEKLKKGERREEIEKNGKEKRGRNEKAKEKRNEKREEMEETREEKSGNRVEMEKKREENRGKIGGNFSLLDQQNLQVACLESTRWTIECWAYSGQFDKCKQFLEEMKSSLVSMAANVAKKYAILPLYYWELCSSISRAEAENFPKIVQPSPLPPERVRLLGADALKTPANSNTQSSKKENLLKHRKKLPLNANLDPLALTKMVMGNEEEMPPPKKVVTAKKKVAKLPPAKGSIKIYEDNSESENKCSTNSNSSGVKKSAKKPVRSTRSSSNRDR